MKFDNLTYLVGSEDLQIRPFVPYEERAVRFLDDLSRELRRNPACSEFPDVATFAFWCRKGNVLKKKAAFEQSGGLRLGRGLAFHIAPSNIPVNFAFSFAFGLLAGNGNVVRVPSKEFRQVFIICEGIQNVLQREEYADLRRMNAFVRYPHQDEITRHFSSRCDVRVIWGGDQTIRALRNIPIPERAVEISFSDRYSICMIDADAVSAMDEAALKHLASGFYNDTYLIDQNACSSPQLIFWTGKRLEEGQNSFWEAVFHAAQRYTLEPVHAVDKYTDLLEGVIRYPEPKSVIKMGNLIHRVKLSGLSENVLKLRGKFGLFYEFESEQLESLLPLITQKVQTITYFGQDKEQLTRFVLENRLRGVDRIVPIGKALEIDVLWDGYDLAAAMSRIIEIQ